MASTIQLIGPPELYPLNHPTDKDPLASLDSSFIKTPTANYEKLEPELPMGRTENWSCTFLSSGNPCLDFFFHIVPSTPPESLIRRLESAWQHDSLTTLKLICNLRGVRGTGKTDKEGFYTAALWLHENHPKTLAGNLRWFADFGYFKDLPEILFRLLEGPDVRRIEKKEREMKKCLRIKGRVVRYRGKKCFIKPKPDKKVKKQERRQKRRQKRRIRSTIPREERILAETKKVNLEKENARNLRKQKVISKARKALERYRDDPDYRFLHDRISDLFAEFLISDLQFLKSGEISKISLASKWCPSLDSSFDQYTLLCESIAKRIFPRESNPEYLGIGEAHYAYRVRDRLRKQVLVPLHQSLELPEIYMSSNKWESLPYNRVSSVAMRNYKKIFKKHDEERFKQYLQRVRCGDAKIAAGALLPHEIIGSLNYEDEKDDCEDDNDVAELQWRRMVQDLSEKGKLRDCLAICDVSGSMYGTPLEVSVTLGLLISELSEDPWKGKLITFSEKPQLHKIEGDDLCSKMQFVKRMDWDMNTDFQKVFDLILQVAVNGKLSKEKMIKRLFVFSDMEFDRASSNDWETDYEAIRRKFRESGYESVIPEIVFWNLRDSGSTPVNSKQKGVALVSGYSKNLLSLFLEGVEAELLPENEDADELNPEGVEAELLPENEDADELNPEGVMGGIGGAISGEEYKQLVVLD